MTNTSFDVRFHKTDVYKGKRGVTYWVRWSVAREPFKEPFKGSTLAKSFRSTLESAAKNGEAFDVTSGLPVSWQQKETAAMSCYDLVRSFVDMKWPDAAPKSRKSIADTLAPITEALLTTDKGRPEHQVMRRAIRALCNPTVREAKQPDEIANALDWLSRNMRSVVELDNPDVLRQVVSRFEKKLDGTRAATDTVRLRRTTFGGMLDYAVEKKALTANPFKTVKTKKSKAVLQQVDRRCVANPVQFRTVLREVPHVGRTGRRLVAFFALMYHAGLRPEEALNVADHNLALPPREWNRERECWVVREWGEIHLEKAAPEISAEWTDSGKADEERGLKAREEDEERTVPCSPELALILYNHFDEFGFGPGRGQLFIAERGGRVGSSTYSRTWALARQAAFTPDVARSPLAKRPYDLRHACVSTWLNAGVEGPRVAEWAGHSLAILMRVYAKCIDGGELTARQRVQAAMGGLAASA